MNITLNTERQNCLLSFLSKHNHKDIVDSYLDHQINETNYLSIIYAFELAISENDGVDVSADVYDLYHFLIQKEGGLMEPIVLESQILPII